MPSHDDHEAMNTDQKLVYMANQIATFFASQPSVDASEGVAQHINDFWDPRMRRRFFELAEAGTVLSPVVAAALSKIRRP